MARCGKRTAPGPISEGLVLPPWSLAGRALAPSTPIPISSLSLLFYSDWQVTIRHFLNSLDLGGPCGPVLAS